MTTSPSQQSCKAPVTTAEKVARFLTMLKRLNAKERNFLMRYALCPFPEARLSPRFVEDLADRLAALGIPVLDRTEAAYFGMDYHFEWIEAALLLAGDQMQLSSDTEPGLRFGQRRARVEDVDLLVALPRPDGGIVLVLIEVKGVGSFNWNQLHKKIERLKELGDAIGTQGEWITPVVILMSPRRPSSKTINEVARRLRENTGFWPNVHSNDLLWMELKGFFSDIGNRTQALRIGTCDADGKRAINLAARTAMSYDHWRVERRLFSGKDDKS